MKYLHLYDKQTDYDSVKNTLILPSASLIEKNNHVEYNPHQYVEIAGIKWATMNVGAKSITDYGLYFQWGDTQGYTEEQVGTGDGKKKFASDWSDYDADRDFKKYNSSSEGRKELELVDDAVHAAWGGSWRMPTSGEFKTLKQSVIDKQVSQTFTNENGVYGLLFTEGDKKLFFPACGNAYNGAVRNTKSNGFYWLSSLDNDVNSSCNMYFDSVNLGTGNGNRYFGFAVRGVWDDKITNQS